jgi:hypothetical protein
VLLDTFGELAGEGLCGGRDQFLERAPGHVALIAGKDGVAALV